MNIQYMSTNKIIIFGTLDLAELSHYYLSKDTDYEVIGFTVNKEYLTKDFSPQEDPQLVILFLNLKL